MSWGIRVLSAARIREQADERLRNENARLLADNERLVQERNRANRALAPPRRTHLGRVSGGVSNV